jgi:hypothetical protein
MTPVTDNPSRPWLVIFAELISWGFAAAVIAFALTSDIALEVWQGAMLSGLFLLMRYVTREIRREHVRQAAHERRLSASGHQLSRVP